MTNHYRVYREDGTEVHEGDTIVDFRGRFSTFVCVSRGPEHNGTAKVIVKDHGWEQEYYGSVFNLTVKME